MTVNEALRGAILPLVPVCEPDRYDGDAKEYCTSAVTLTLWNFQKAHTTMQPAV